MYRTNDRDEKRQSMMELQDTSKGESRTSSSYNPDNPCSNACTPSTHYRSSSCTPYTPSSCPCTRLHPPVALLGKCFVLARNEWEDAPQWSSGKDPLSGGETEKPPEIEGGRPNDMVQLMLYSSVQNNSQEDILTFLGEKSQK